MFCSKCGSKSPVGARFCNKCGTKVINETPNTVIPEAPPQQAIPPVLQHNLPPQGYMEPQHHQHSSYIIAQPSPGTVQVQGYSAYPPELIPPTTPVVTPVVTPMEVPDSDLLAHASKLAESMDYMYFPTEPTSQDKKDKISNFIDYPLGPTKPSPPKPVAPVDPYSYYSNTPVAAPNVVIPQATPVYPPPVESPVYAMPPTTHAHNVIPSYPPVQAPPIQASPVQPPPIQTSLVQPPPTQTPPVQPPPTQTSPVQPPPTQTSPVQPPPTQTPPVQPPTIQASPVQSPPIPEVQTFPTYPTNPPPTPIESQVFPVFPTNQPELSPVEPAVFTDFPKQFEPEESINTISEKPDFPARPIESQVDTPIQTYIPPISVLPQSSTDIMGQINDDFQAPRQIDTDLLFMDDDIVIDSPYITRPAKPELLFMDNTDRNKQTSPHQTITAIPRPMEYDDYQNADMPDYGGFARNPDPDLFAPAPKKSRLPIIFMGISIILAAAIVFFVYMNGNVSQDDVVGTWVQRGPTMGSVVTRLQFNRDGSGREYRFNELHQIVESETSFEWHIEGRNTLVNSLWEENVVVQMSNSTGQITLRYRFESQDYWYSWAPVRVAP